jgi:phosphoribosylaminoimidazolecarboxamide formyltransferase/IMP cyclohydrolase
LGGRVKTLHPKVFGGILSRRDNPGDASQLAEYEIPEIDLVIVDLYPFEKTVASGAGEQEIIEKIDIGGISLIRAAAKNFRDVVIVPSQNVYIPLLSHLNEKNGEFSLEDRKWFAGKAFGVSSHYDAAIFSYFNNGVDEGTKRISLNDGEILRYGENPHQSATFFNSKIPRAKLLWPTPTFCRAKRCRITTCSMPMRPGNRPAMHTMPLKTLKTKSLFRL